MVYAKGTFLLWGFSIPSFRAYSLCYRQTKWWIQKILSVTGTICAKFQNHNICI